MGRCPRCLLLFGVSFEAGVDDDCFLVLLCLWCHDVFMMLLCCFNGVLMGLLNLPQDLQHWDLRNSKKWSRSKKDPFWLLK